MANEDHRAHYRQAVPEGTFSVSLAIEGLKSPAFAHSVDMSYGGTGVAVHREVGRLLTVNQIVTALVSSPRVSGLLIRAPVRVAHLREREDGGFAVGLEWENASALHKGLPPELAAFLNRRKAFRVAVGAKEVVPIAIERPGPPTASVTLPVAAATSSSPSELPVAPAAVAPGRGTLLDIGSTGMAFSIDAVTQKNYGAEDELILRFKLGCEGESIVAHGTVRWRKTTADGRFRLGVSFDGHGVRDWVKAERTIAHYVTRRQIEARHKPT